MLHNTKTMFKKVARRKRYFCAGLLVSQVKCCCTQWFSYWKLWVEEREHCVWSFPGGSAVKIWLLCRRQGFDPWVGKMPWRRAWQPTPVFLPGESHGQEERGGLQSLGPQRVRTVHRVAESDTTERVNNNNKWNES